MLWHLSPSYRGLSIQTGHLILRLNATSPELIFHVYYIKIKPHFYLMINSDSTAQKFEDLNVFHGHQLGLEDNWTTGPRPCIQAYPIRLSLSYLSLIPTASCTFTNEGQKTNPNAWQQVMLKHNFPKALFCCMVRKRQKFENKLIQICKLFWLKLTDYSTIYRYFQVATKIHQSVYHNIPVL